MLRVARELLGISQEALADELRLERRAVQRAEASTPSASLERQQLFVEYFRKRGIQIEEPNASQAAWGIAEKFDRGERQIPSRFLRAARIGLDQSQETLGKGADLGTMTIRRIEAAVGTVQHETRLYLIAYLERAGVSFLPPNSLRGWQVTFASGQEEPTARHPRFNLQQRKQAARRV
jgi:transcriptional regulator with XRE-family HTH domain